MFVISLISCNFISNESFFILNFVISISEDKGYSSSFINNLQLSELFSTKISSNILSFVTFFLILYLIFIELNFVLRSI